MKVDKKKELINRLNEIVEYLELETPTSNTLEVAEDIIAELEEHLDV